MKGILCFLLLIPYLVLGQSGKYTISGILSGDNPPSKVYLLYNIGAVTKIDSVSIINESFNFTGTISEPMHANLVFDHAGAGLNNINPSQADRRDFYLEKGNLHLEIKDSISNAVFKGSGLNDDYFSFQGLLKPVLKKFNTLMAGYYTLPEDQQNSPAMRADLAEKYKTLESEQKSILLGYAKKHPDKLVSLDALKIYGGSDPDVNEILPLFNKLSPAIRNTLAGKNYAELLSEFKMTAIGSLAPDFVQNDPEDKPVRLSSLRGKYVLIDFWASWCGPCRQENPNIVQVYNEYKDRNFTILGVSLDRPGAKKAWLRAISDDKLTWTQVSDLSFWKNAAAAKYGVRAIPQNFLLDPQGKIIAKNLRGDDLKKALAELIK